MIFSLVIISIVQDVAVDEEKCTTVVFAQFSASN